MAENQTIKERLLLFIKSQNLGKSQFENLCGFSHGWLNRIQKTLMPDKLETICLHFPDLNPSWLMTGEGTMLRIDATASTEEEEIAKKTDMYKAVVEDNQRLREENEELKKRIERLEKMVDRLLGDSTITPSKCNG